MWRIITYLNSPELVVGFQRLCGLVPAESFSHVNQNGLVNANGSVKEAPVTTHRRKAEQVANGSLAHDSNSNYKSANSQNDNKVEVSKTDLNESLHPGELKPRVSLMRQTEIPGDKTFQFLWLVEIILSL